MNRASTTKGRQRMATRQIQVQRVSVTSSRSFHDVVARLEATVGRPDMKAFWAGVAAARTEAELEVVVHKAIGSSGLMEFVRLDMGEVLRKERGAEAPETLRLLIGNLLIMKQMVKVVPDAGSYAPVTILIDERPDGVHLSYDRMASFLASYGSPEALAIAQDLDSKAEALLAAAAL
jgi:uncharacterized protein (DUF302 family)